MTSQARNVGGPCIALRWPLHHPPYNLAPLSGFGAGTQLEQPMAQRHPDEARGIYTPPATLLAQQAGQHTAPAPDLRNGKYVHRITHSLHMDYYSLPGVYYEATSKKTYLSTQLIPSTCTKGCPRPLAAFSIPSMAAASSSAEPPPLPTSPQPIRLPSPIHVQSSMTSR